MKPETLPGDIARCDGIGYFENGIMYWRVGCETCLRRTAPRPKRCNMMIAPLIIALECEFLIEPRNRRAVSQSAILKIADKQKNDIMQP